VVGETVADPDDGVKMTPERESDGVDRPQADAKLPGLDQALPVTPLLG
jgi:hypothetical protein